MLYKPLEPASIFNPVCLVYAGENNLTVWSDNGAQVAHTEQEARDLLQQFGDHVIFAASPFSRIRQATGKEDWLIYKWAKVSAWMQLGEARIISSRGIFAGLQEHEAAAELFKIERQAKNHGVQLGSWSSVARQLWRMTLEEPIRFSGRQLKRNGFYGGRKDMRKEIRGQTLRNIMHIDLKGAYPAAMIEAPIPTKMIRDIPRLDGEGISNVTIRMPSTPWALVPERLKSSIIRWKSGRTLTGWYSNQELRAAMEGGADIEVHETWLGTREMEPFKAWADIITPLRMQEGPAGKYWKGASNALWGLFSMSQQGGEAWVLNDRGLPGKVDGFPNSKPPGPSAAFVATIISARVRSRLLLEALGNGWNGQALYVDTDGAMLQADSPIPPTATDTPSLGEWSIDGIMPKVLIKGLQAWAYWDANNTPHVTLAGKPDATVHDLMTGHYEGIIPVGS